LKSEQTLITASEALEDCTHDGREGPRLRVLRSASELDEMRQLWRSSCVNPNCDIDYFLTVVDSRSNIVRPHVTVVSGGDGSKAIVVARLEDAILETKFGYRVLFRSRVRQLTVVYGGLMGDLSAANAASVIASLKGALGAGEADVVFFNSVSVDSPVYAAARSAGGVWGKDYFEEIRPHWRARLAGDYKTFVSTLSSNTRHNLRRYSSRLVKTFGSRLVVKRFSAPDDLDTIMTDTELVASQTYHRGLGVGFVPNQEMRRLTELALKQGWFRAYILYIDEAPCAFWNGWRYGRTFYTGSTGSDSAYGEHRIGTFLLTKLFEDLCDNRLADYLDFGFGDAQYKRDFCEDHWNEATFRLYAPTLRGFLVNGIRTPILAAERAGRQLLGRTALLDKAKRAWRQRVTGSVQTQ